VTVTPGKAAHDTWCADDDWHELDDEARDLWEQTAQAGAAAALSALRDGVAALAVRLEASAKATMPSRKSGIESSAAAELRDLLEG
jgi:hypothetical protein